MKKVALLLICVIGAVLTFSACKPKAKSLKITPPTTLSYEVGTNPEDIDLTGGKVGVLYSDKSVKDETALKKEMLSPFSLATEGKVPVTVNYKDFTGTFDLTVTPKTDYITLKQEPYKTSYSSLAKVNNVELRGAIVTVHYVDGTTLDVPLSRNADAVVKDINATTRKIKFEYKGMKCEYSFTLNEDEVGYMTVTKNPDRIAYRNNTTNVADVDLTGGEFDLFLSGGAGTNYKMDSAALRDYITVKSIDVAKGYITIQLDPTFTEDGAAYENDIVEGYLDIDVVNKWVTGVKFKNTADKPTAGTYDVSVITENKAISLDGGVLTLSYNNPTVNTETTLPLSGSELVTIFDRELDESSEFLGKITLRYQDNVVSPTPITCSYTVAVTGHNDITKLQYCAFVLRKYADISTDRWTESPMQQLSQRHADVAKQGYDLYIDSTQIVTSGRNKYAAEGNLCARAFAYYSYAQSDINLAEFYASYNTIVDHTKVAAFETKCRALEDDLYAMYQRLYRGNTIIGNLSADEEGNLQTSSGAKFTISMVNSRTASYYSYIQANRLGANRAYEIFVSYFNSEYVKLGQEGKESVDPGDVSAAYDIIVNGVVSGGTSDASTISPYLCSILETWRWDCLDIIYEAQPLDTAKSLAQNTKINALHTVGAYPYLINALSVAADSAMTWWHNRAVETAFIYYHNTYYEYYDMLFDTNYAYKAAPYLFGKLSSSVYYDPKVMNSAATGTAGYQSIANTTIKGYIDGHYTQLNTGTVSFNLITDSQGNFSEAFLEFLDAHVALLEQFFNSGLAFDEFVSSFINEAGLFNGLSLEEQWIFAIYDEYPGYGVSMYYVFANYYYGDLSSDHLALFELTWVSWSQVFAPLEIFGYEAEYITDIVKYLNDEGFTALYSKLSNNLVFTNLFGDEFELVKARYDELKVMPAEYYTDYNIVQLMHMSKMYYEKSNNGSNSLYGFFFIQNYRLLLDEIADWGGTSFGTYRFLGASMNDVMSSFVTLYNNLYSDYEDTEPFETLLTAAINYFSSARTTYVESKDFAADMEFVIDEFIAMDSNDIDTFWFYNTTINVLVTLIGEYYYTEGMTSSELDVFYAVYINYISYLQIIHVRGGGLSLNETITLQYLEDEYETAMQENIRLYNKLMAEGSLTQTFTDSDIADIYSIIMDLYNDIVA